MSASFFLAGCDFFRSFFGSITSLYCQGWYDPKRLETDADWPLEEIQQQEFVESVHAHHRVILLYPNITGIIWGECLKILM